MPDPEGVVRAGVRNADLVVTLSDPRGRAAALELVSILEEADARLSRRLRREAAKYGGMAARFTGAQALQYREQIRVILEYVRGRLAGLTASQASYAIAQSMRDTMRLLDTLERHFTGIAAPLRMRQAAVMDSITRGMRASLLRQHLTSVDRYGTAMIGQFERRIRAGMISGASQDEMIAALTGHGGPTGRVSMAATVSADGTVIRLREEDIPEGLFKRHRYWAERIVRTETAHAYNEAKIQGLFVERAGEMPDMRKKIMAVMDNRTAPDSIAVHGQVRELEEEFEDGAGRRYLRPPARPNDRETIIPWRPHWRETAASRPLTARMREAAEHGAMPRGLRAFRTRQVRTQRRSEMAQTAAVERREQAQERARARIQVAAEQAERRRKR